jgi:hypothetical protein
VAHCKRNKAREAHEFTRAVLGWADGGFSH